MKVSVFLHTIKSQVGFMDATHNAFEDLKLFTRFVICYHICVFLMITPPAEYQQLRYFFNKSDWLTYRKDAITSKNFKYGEYHQSR